MKKPQSPSKLFSAPSHQQPTLVKPRDCPEPIQQQISVLSLYQHVLIFWYGPQSFKCSTRVVTTFYKYVSYLLPPTVFAVYCSKEGKARISQINFQTLWQLDLGRHFHALFLPSDCIFHVVNYPSTDWREDWCNHQPTILTPVQTRTSWRCSGNTPITNLVLFDNNSLKLFDIEQQRLVRSLPAIIWASIHYSWLS